MPAAAGEVAAATRPAHVRAVGPTLGAAPFNVPGAISDPKIDVADASGRVIFTNDNGAPFRGVAANAAKKAAKENFPGRQLAGHNGPLRSGKGTAYEGGIRVPFIVRWPGVVPAGATSDVPVAHVDVYPTLLSFAGGTPRPMDLLRVDADGKPWWCANLASGGFGLK